MILLTLINEFVNLDFLCSTKKKGILYFAFAVFGKNKLLIGIF